MVGATAEQRWHARLRPLLRVRASTWWVLGAVIVPAAALSIALQRHGHTWGDDFALYLRQATSLFDGNVGQVLADNKVNVDSAAKPGFSPYSYPWGFPLLLAPFVRLWGTESAEGIDRLKLVEVACLCGFLWWWFVLLRRRMAPWLAVAACAVTGYSLPYLLHTGALLSELPYMCAAAGTLCFLDRCGARSDLGWDRVDRRSLVGLGLLMVLVFNVRREGLAIVPAVMAAQAARTWPLRHARPVPWRALATPHAVFAGGVVLAQLLLPSALAPRYDGAGLDHTWRKLRTTFQESGFAQLGFEDLASSGRLAIGAVVAAGVVVAVRRRPAADLPLLTFAAGSLVIVGMIPADSARYTMAVVPFAIYFGLQALAAIPRSRSLVAAAAAGALVVLGGHDVPKAVRDARRAADQGEVLTGPYQPAAVEMFATVRSYAHPDELVAFFKGRALTLYTDRRAVQSSEVPVVLERADWWVTSTQPTNPGEHVTTADAARLGLVEVWRNEDWILWQVPPQAPSSGAPAGSGR